MNNTMELNIPISQKPRVVVIGGGFGGLSVVNTLKNKDVQVVLLDKHNYHTFQPLLYQIATGGLETGSIAFPLRRFVKTYKNTFYRMANVENIDTDNKMIKTNIGDLHFDYLVIATGSESNFFGNKELEKLSLGLKTIPQALDLRSLILQNFELAALSQNVEERQALLNFVVVGGGPTGVEMAGALAELKKHVFIKDYPDLDVRTMQIHLLEGSDRLLNSMSKEASTKSKEFLEKLGVNVWLDTKMLSYDGNTVFLEKEKNINTKTLVWTAGVKGTIPNGIKDLYLLNGTRILVNDFNQINDFKDIFAIGDVAAQVNNDFPKGHPMVAPVAMQHGKHVAKNILRNIEKKELKPFKYFDKGSMATIGRNKAVVDLHKIKFQGFFAWLVWTFVHLMSIVGFRNKLIIFVDWLWNYVSFDRALRIIIRPYQRE